MSLLSDFSIRHSPPHLRIFFMIRLPITNRLLFNLEMSHVTDNIVLIFTNQNLNAINACVELLRYAGPVYSRSSCDFQNGPQWYSIVATGHLRRARESGRNVREPGRPGFIPDYHAVDIGLSLK